MRVLVLAVILAGLVQATPVEAQQAGRVARIGYLSTSSAEADRAWVTAFRQRLGELGYVEGESIVIEQRHAAQRPERLSQLAAELVRLRVDAIVVYGTPAVEAARRVTSEIPIIFTVAADPVDSGYVASLARPGGNITGCRTFTQASSPNSSSCSGKPCPWHLGSPSS